jgi:hypothetical protein
MSNTDQRNEQRDFQDGKTQGLEGRGGSWFGSEDYYRGMRQGEAERSLALEARRRDDEAGSGK